MCNLIVILGILAILAVIGLVAYPKSIGGFGYNPYPFPRPRFNDPNYPGRFLMTKGTYNPYPYPPFSYNPKVKAREWDRRWC